METKQDPTQVLTPADRSSAETTDHIPDAHSLDELLAPLSGAADRLALFSADEELRDLLPAKSTAELLTISMLTADALRRDPEVAKALSLPPDVIHLVLALDTAVGQLGGAIAPITEATATAVTLLDQELSACAHAIDVALDAEMADPETPPGQVRVLRALFGPGRRLQSSVPRSEPMLPPSEPLHFDTPPALSLPAGASFAPVSAAPPVAVTGTPGIKAAGQPPVAEALVTQPATQRMALRPAVPRPALRKPGSPRPGGPATRTPPARRRPARRKEAAPAPGTLPKTLPDTLPDTRPGAPPATLAGPTRGADSRIDQAHERAAMPAADVGACSGEPPAPSEGEAAGPR